VKVTGTPDELAMSGWIIRNLDQPSPAPDPFLVAGKSDDGIRIFHVARAAATSPQAMQELLTVIRTVADIQKVFYYTDHADLVVRGPAADLGLAEFLISSLDQTPDPQRTAMTMSPEYQYNSGRGTDTVRVFYLAHSAQPQQTQEILTTLRTVLQVQKIFNFTAMEALVLRATPETVTAAEWMIRSLDLPADGQNATREFTASTLAPGGAMIHVLYPANLRGRALSQTLTSLRTDLNIHQAFLKTTPATLVVRGSADQVTKADQLIQTADQAAKP
jgi:type II secretory pathway component GspD/PulD (secretin)